jgi:thiol-disulfide isomerase/thioredoxin
MKYLVLNNERILKRTGLVRALSVNFILLLAHLLFKDAQFTLCTGVWLMFLFSYLANPILRIGSLAGLFLLSIFPFILFIYFRHSQVYFDGISWDSFYAIYPYLSVFLIAVFISFIIGVLIQKLIKSPKIKQRIIFSLTALTFAILSGSQGWAFQFSFTGLAYFIAVILYKNSSIKDVLLFSVYLLLPYFVIFGFSIIYNNLIHIYPLLGIPVIGVTIGILCHMLYKKSKRTWGVALVILYFLFLIFGYWGMKNYVQFAFGLNDSPFVKEIKFDFYNSTDDSYTNKEIEGKTTVIYFHNKTCSVCYKKLPELESLYHEFKSDTNIVIVAAFLPYNTFEDTSFIFNFHRKLKYSYPQYISRESANIYEERFNIDGYPHVTIIGKEGNIIHNGLFNNDPMVFVNNARLFILDDN